MGALDRLTQQGNQNRTLGTTGYTFYDADTLMDADGNRLRIQGIDAPEVQKLVDGQAKLGTAGGEAATDTIAGLANKQGFTEVRNLGETDVYGRQVVDLINPNTGESFRSAILSNGVLDTTRYTEAEDSLAAKLGQATREQEVLAGIPQDDAWDQARLGLQTAMTEEGHKQAGFRQTARDEAELAFLAALAKQQGMDPDWVVQTQDVSERDYSRDLANKANNPLAIAWDTGLEGAAEGLYGALEWAGDVTGWEWASLTGEAGQLAARARLEQNPNIKLNAFDADGNWDFDGIWGKDGFAQYVMNNAVVSVPYMAATVGASFLAPLTGGASYALPVALYTGQTYAEQEGDNKDAGIALAAGIGQAALDKLGLDIILPKGGFLSSKVRNEIAQKLVDTGKATNIKAAKLQLANASRASIAEIAGEAGKFAKDQITARNISRQLLQKGLIGGAGEAATEAMQEAIGYTAANHANGYESWDAREFNDRIMNAIVAGGTLGVGFTAPGTAIDVGAWADVAYRQAPSTSENRAWAADQADNDIARYGQQVNVQQWNAQNKDGATMAKDHVETVSQRNERNKDRKENRTTTQLGKDLLAGIPGLWRGLTRHAFDRELQEKSDTARYMGESFGSALQRSTSGATYENRKHHLVTEYKNLMPSVTRILTDRGYSKATRKARLEYSDKFYTAYQRALAKAEAEGREIDLDKDVDLIGKELDQFKGLLAEINTVADRMHKDQARHNPDLGYVKDYLAKYKSFDKAAIEKNRGDFEKALQDELNMNPAQARETTDNILNQQGINSFDDFAATAEAAGKPGSHQRRSLGLSEKEAFKNFMEGDVFTNVGNAAKSAARYVSHSEFVGVDNEKLNYNLDKIEKELIASGMSPSKAQKRVDKLASDMTDYLDAESGNYKRIKSPLLNGIQKNLLFVTTLTGLPLATVSNFVEFMMITRGLTAQQVKQMEGTAEAYAKEVKNYLRSDGSRAFDETQQTGGHAVAKDLGFFEWEVGAAHTTGVTETGHVRQRLMDQYFKIIGLQGWTNATRSARAAIAGDYIINHVEQVASGRGQERELRYQYESREALRNLGIDPDFMVDYLNGNLDAEDANVQAQFEAYMRDGAFNFVNEAVAMPQSANRPKIFQDPRFALFTQFQGFISTFQANHLPRMWNEYVARGTPAMKYNAFALLATMILLGFLSQALKDLIKYGTFTENPYLKGTDYIRRGVGASGWLGTAERAIDFVFPVYEERYYNPIDWAFGTITGESASISKVVRAGGITGKVLTGEKDPSEYLKLSPLSQAIYNNSDFFTFGG